MLKHNLMRTSTNPEKAKLVTIFNENVLKLATQLSKIVPESLIAKNLSNLGLVIRTTPKKAIEVFVLYVLEHKSKIDAGDETYFLNNDYENITSIDKDNTQRMFEFKDVWGKLSDENKQLVIQYMQFLCDIAQQYFLIKQEKKNKKQ
jgi:hypothetical protein